MLPFDVIVCKHKNWVEWIAQYFDKPVVYHSNGQPASVGGVPVYTSVSVPMIEGKRVLGVIPYSFAVYADTITTLMIPSSPSSNEPLALSRTMKVILA